MANIDSTARDILTCVCEAFTEAERPVCSCYATVGNPFIATCCECESEDDPEDFTPMGNAILQVERIYDASLDTLQQIQPVHPCKRTATVMDLTIWITRCYPTIDIENDNYLDNEAVDEAATGVHTDLGLLYKALTCCSDQRVLIRQVSVQGDPQIGCSTIVGQVTVEVQP